MFLAQSDFPCTVVGQKDCATTAFRYRFAAAACCHGRSFPLYRRNLERISPFRHAAPVRACHSEPVLTLVWQSVSPVPAPAGASPPFYVLPPAGYFCHQRQKYPKTPLETTFQDFLGALRPVSNLPHVPRVIGFSRVPLSVKRTVPPQLSATASLPLPRATVAAFPSTAVPGYSPPNAAALVRTVIPSQSADWRGNPSS